MLLTVKKFIFPVCKDTSFQQLGRGVIKNYS